MEDGFWTRRETLAAGALLMAAALAPASFAGSAPFPDDGLRAYARSVGADPAVATLGRAAAGGRDAHALEAALRARVPGARDEAGWRDALRDAGGEDLKAEDVVCVFGRRLMRVEADFLALAALLQPVG